MPAITGRTAETRACPAWRSAVDTMPVAENAGAAVGHYASIAACLAASRSASAASASMSAASGLTV